MLEARQIYSDYSYQQRPVIGQQKAKIKKTGMMQAKIFVVVCILLAVITGLMLTATYSQITHQADKITQIKKEISDLQNANERLKLEIARLKSLDRIELIAMTELGMVPPGINDIEYIAFNSKVQVTASPETAEGENKVAVEVPSGDLVHPVILAVNKIIAEYVFDMKRSDTDI